MYNETIERHPYFDYVLTRRPELKLEWCIRVVGSPLRTEQQANGRINHWGVIPEFGDRTLRVITLPDGTLFNAYFDREFKP